MKTTPEHFKYFSERVGYYQVLYGLVDYEIYCRHEDMKKAEGMCKHSRVDRIARIILAKDVPTMPEQEPDTTEYLDSIARHEIYELLIGDMAIMAGNNDINEDDIQCEGHRIIHRLDHAYRYLTRTNNMPCVNILHNQITKES
jgi:hypothetical protein